MKRKINYRFLGIFIAIFFTFNFNNAFAEKEIGVTGQVKDAKTKKAIEFCSVRIFNMKDSLITGAVTDSRGFFVTPLARGNYKFLIEYIGYITDTTEVNIVTGNEFLGTFKLEQDNSIEEVVIEGETKENLIDKDVYLVTKDLKTGAANTKDVLAKVKGVNYDRYNNSIQVDGDKNIIILVNGLEKDQEYIKNLAPDRLKKIEVIRDPSGRYALEGYSAVINVILKNDYKGTEFFIENQAIFDIDNEETKYIYPINNFNASLNYTYNKVNLYTKYRNNSLNMGITGTSEKKYSTGREVDNEAPTNNKQNFVMNNLHDNLTIGADYYLNPKHTISVETNFNGLGFSKNNQLNNSHSIHLLNGVVTKELDIEIDNKSDNKSSYYSAFYIGKLDKDNTIKLDFSFSENSGKYNNKYLEDNVLQRTEIGENTGSNTKLYAELNHTFNIKSSIQLGYGNTNKFVSNTFNSGLNDNNFKYSDLRHKLYAYYSLKLNKQIGIKIGGAAETSMPKSEELKTRYFIYQPLVDIKYQPIKMLDVRFKYRTSNYYPSTAQANPFEYIIDNETVQKGNPNIKPSTTHKVSVKFNIMKGLASIEPYYHFSNNDIVKTGTLRADNKFEYNYNNAGKYEHKGIKGNLTIPFGKSLFLQTNADFYMSKVEFENHVNDVKDWTMNSQLIYVNKKYNTVTGLIYQNQISKRISALGYNKYNNDFTGFFIQQPFLKKKLNVMIFYILPISFGNDYDQGSYVKTDEYTELNIQDMHFIHNAMVVRISYRINKGKSIRKTDKDIKKDEEKSSGGGMF